MTAVQKTTSKNVHVCLACWTCGGPQLTRPLFRRRAARTVTNQTMDKESKSCTVRPGVQHMQTVIEGWEGLTIVL
jgi:hypothetical protein